MTEPGSEPAVGAAARAAIEAAIEPGEDPGAAVRLAAVRQRVARAATAAGRDPASLVLVAVSKNQPLDAVLALAALGVRDFGENRHQEAAPKAEAAPDLHWHFLGRLQRNKARAVGRWACTVHSVDRLDVLDLLAPPEPDGPGPGRALEVFVQVSLDGDPTRGGVLPAAVPALADAVSVRPTLRLLGVMAVAPATAPARPAFAALRATSEDLVRGHPGARFISAGMSGDLEDAITEGATHLRVGTALFGPRA